jgi:ketosteroid isomerase-like protein
VTRSPGKAAASVERARGPPPCENGAVTETNVELARRGYEAALRGDLDTIREFLDPDVKWHGGDRSAPGACHNREQALEFMREARSRGGVGELVDVVDAGEQVVVIMRPPPHQGEPAEMIANLTTFRDGKVREMVHYANPDDALAAAGVAGKLDKDAAARGRAWRIVGVEPIFTVADVERALDHYRRLGFTTSTHDETYAFAHRDGLTIHLTAAEPTARASRGGLYLHVDDADRLAEAWRAAGMQVLGPEDYDYGKREGSHTDGDGNLLRFGSPLRRPAA